MRREERNENTNIGKGFASMSKEQIHNIASKGGHASAEDAGYEGMAERGSKGGNVSAERAGQKGMAERGRNGGEASSAARRAKSSDDDDDDEETE